MSLEFRVEGNWILPNKGTFGNKARNLYNNRRIIHEKGSLIPRSMVIPYEYLSFGYTAIVDAIYRYFKDCATVAVRSNAPDEDLGERKPGLYRSEKIELDEDRDGTEDLVGAVVKSYNYSWPTDLRRERGIRDRGMSLLVQEFAPPDYCGSFSDIGEVGILTFTNPKHELRSMIRGALSKYRVDKGGHILAVDFPGYYNPLANRLRILASSLPTLENDLGWELEFVFNRAGMYILQTTPIKKQSSFRVIPSEGNIFKSGDVTGWGNFRTNGVLYMPFVDSNILQNIERENRDYCIVTNYFGISSGADKDLIRTKNSNVLICIEDRFPGVNPFSAHVGQFVRQRGACAMLGRFTNELDNLLVSSKEISHNFHNRGMSAPILFSPTSLDIQADEMRNASNIEVVGEMMPFVKLREM